VEQNLTAAAVVAALEDAQDDRELANVRKRVRPEEPAIGVRMGHLFAIAKTHQRLPLDEIETLLAHRAYEPRMAAFCILDFQARRTLDDAQRRALYDTYLGHHDAITTWDMVDRSAPRVVGGYLVDRSPTPLHELAASTDPLRRRTAITAPLFFVHNGDDAHLDDSFQIAATLAQAPEPEVHNAVGIFLKHAGTRDEAALFRFLDDHAASMPRPALRLATEKLSSDDRARYRA
jgi:3-methyladenine DNA glycosylase AlkD